MRIERLPGIKKPAAKKALPQCGTARIFAAHIMMYPLKEGWAQMRIRLARPKSADLILLEDCVAAEQLVSAFAAQYGLDIRSRYRIGKQK